MGGLMTTYIYNGFHPHPPDPSLSPFFNWFIVSFSILQFSFFFFGRCVASQNDRSPGIPGSVPDLTAPIFFGGGGGLFIWGGGRCSDSGVRGFFFLHKIDLVHPRFHPSVFLTRLCRLLFFFCFFSLFFAWYPIAGLPDPRPLPASQKAESSPKHWQDDFFFYGKG